MSEFTHSQGDQEPLQNPVQAMFEQHQSVRGFRSALSPHGSGEVLIAPTQDGCLTIAPPYVPATRPESRLARLDFRVAFWAPNPETGEISLDQDRPEITKVRFADLFTAPQLEEHKDYLYQCFWNKVRILNRYRDFLTPDGVLIAEPFLEEAKEDFEQLFPGREWPFSQET